MMEQTTYYFWKRDWVTGFYKLVPRTRNTPGNHIVSILIIVGCFILIGSIMLMSLPFWICILGFGVNKQFRYLVGLISILGLFYFYLDVHNEWLSRYFFIGYFDEEQKFQLAILGNWGYRFFLKLNIASTIFGCGFIIDWYLNRESKIVNFLIIFAFSLVIGFSISSYIVDNMLKRNIELNPAEILEADSSSGQTLGVTDAVPESVSMQSSDQNYEVLPIAIERNYKEQKTLENLETFPTSILNTIQLKR